MEKRLLWITVVLVLFGLVMLASAGIVDGQKKFGSSYYFAKHQLLFGALPGLVLMFVFSKVPFGLWRKVSWLILFGALALMGLVFTSQFGLVLKGARSWIHIASYTFQPAEILKLALVIYLAAWFSGRSERVKNWSYGVIPFFAVLGLIGGLLMLQPDLGTLTVVALISLGIYFIAGIRIKDLAILGLVGVVIFTALVMIAPYRFDRIKAFINPTRDPRGISYQVNQAKISIGAGGLFGVGYGQSTQKFGFLPEAAGDSIFAVISEELGLTGALATIGMLALLCYSLAKAAMVARDKFSRLYLMGLNTWIMSQAIINIAAISGIGPLTGLPLPFISYGGTALITLLSGMGIALNMVRTA